MDESTSTRTNGLFLHSTCNEFSFLDDHIDIFNVFENHVASFVFIVLTGDFTRDNHAHDLFAGPERHRA